ncbi:hypothetical protein H632_c57p3 [Helicosporidium sp. ATCC 50920]|nr:hypothetical protein H632_c57p3 [Helicosporidium sp. ATCC 50920]|eukprot:KDD76954.1 hypothetical protein H632_c57p3 [Helicosporidium sp. ATCC 50920]
MERLEADGATGDYRSDLSAKMRAAAQAVQGGGGGEEVGGGEVGEERGGGEGGGGEGGGGEGTGGEGGEKGKAPQPSAIRSSPLDFVMVHIKAVDDAGHDRLTLGKVRLLEAVDKAVGQLVCRLEGGRGPTGRSREFFVAVTSDHSTPVEGGDHSFEPVPFALAAVEDVVAELGGAAALARTAPLDEIKLSVTMDDRRTSPRGMASETPYVSAFDESHVVSGYVGNKAAVFPLQLLGFEVDAVHTVHLSNHTGYPIYKGTVLKSAELWEIVHTMDSNGLLAQITHLLTGFVGSGELMAVFERVIRLLRARNPDLVYVCDPVQGDHGILYVSPELPPLFRQLIAHATVLTPNQFEAGLLLNRPLKGLRDARQACEELLDKGPAVVVLTSLDLPAWPQHVTIVAAQRLDGQEGATVFRELEEDGDALQPCSPRCSFLILRVPRLKAYFTGTGDLLSALLLAHLHREKNSLRPALEVAVAALQTVLADTAAHSQSAADIKSRDAATCRRQELRLVQNAQALLRPPVQHRARELTEKDLEEDDRAAAAGENG